MSKSELLDRVNILGVEIDAVTKAEVLAKIDVYLNEKRKTGYITKPYVEFLALAKDDPVLQNVLNKSFLCLADGISLQWAASYLYGVPKTKPSMIKLFWTSFVKLQNHKWRNQIIPEKMAGVDLTIPVLKLAENEHLNVGVLGGPTDYELTAKKLTRQFPGLGKVDSWNGYYNLHDERKLVEDIAASKIDILFVAMGFPKQELFMAKYQDYIGAKLMIGEGGSFDYVSLGGNIKRAPKWMQKIGIEWLWRLLRQPSRIKRQLAIPRFVWAIHKQAKSNWHKTKLQ